MRFCQEYVVSSLAQVFSVVLCECDVANSHEVIVEGSVGALGRTDSHLGEVQL